MKRISLLTLFLSFTFKSLACLCWFPTDKQAVAEKISKADVILYVTVMPDSLCQNFSTGDSSLHVTEAMFKVLTTWKGEQVKTIKFKAKKYPCGDAGYRVGERYIIFGYCNQETGELETNNCNSLSEETVPEPRDKITMKSKDFDLERYNRATSQMRKEFESIENLISKQTSQ